MTQKPLAKRYNQKVSGHLGQDKVSRMEKKVLPPRLFSLFVQGRAPPAIAEYAVWGLNPTGGGIKSRKELSGGESRSAEEGPRFLRGLGIPPKIGAQITPKRSSITFQISSQISSQNRHQPKVQFRLKFLSKSRVYKFPHKTDLFSVKNDSNPWEKVPFIKRELNPWVGIGQTSKK